MGVQLPKGEQHKVSSKSEGCWLEKEQQKSNTEGSGQPQLVTYTRTSVDDRVDSSGGMWKSGSEQLLQCFHTT